MTQHKFSVIQCDNHYNKKFQISKIFGPLRDRHLKKTLNSLQKKDKKISFYLATEENFDLKSKN